MSNYDSGHAAEKEAATYLQKHGFNIKQLNWRTKYCEIDIIAEKDKAIYFVEVKSRKNMSQGSGLEYITSAKLRQMGFAAEMWVSENNWSGDYQLAAISIDSDEITFLAEI